MKGNVTTRLPVQMKRNRQAFQPLYIAMQLRR